LSTPPALEKISPRLSSPQKLAAIEIWGFAQGRAAAAPKDIRARAR